MILLDGKALAAQIKDEIATEVKSFLEKGMRPPKLAVIMVGDNKASASYVRNKIKSCQQVGFDSLDIKLPADISQQKLIEHVQILNNDPQVDGFIVQLPLPQHIDQQAVIDAIDYRKDVDGFHPINLGRTLLGLPAFYPATPKGIVEMFKRYNIDTQGKHIVIVGRSNIVGKPLAAMLIQKNKYANATVTICHSHTPNIKKLTLEADILVAAIGKPRFITADMVKDGAVVIDVGINSIPDKSKKSGYRLVGDVDFDNVAPKTSFITPVPGGVGQMTVAALMMNTLWAYKKIIY